MKRSVARKNHSWPIAVLRRGSAESRQMRMIGTRLRVWNRHLILAYHLELTAKIGCPSQASKGTAACTARGNWSAAAPRGYSIVILIPVSAASDYISYTFDLCYCGIPLFLVRLFNDVDTVRWQLQSSEWSSSLPLLATGLRTTPQRKRVRCQRAFLGQVRGASCGSRPWREPSQIGGPILPFLAGVREAYRVHPVSRRRKMRCKLSCLRNSRMTYSTH